MVLKVLFKNTKQLNTAIVRMIALLLESGFRYNSDLDHRHYQKIMDQETQQEIARLSSLVDEFSEEMKVRLREQAIKGYRGWDDSANYRRILEMMMEHASVSSGQEVDAANLAMILWYLRKRSDI